MLYCCGSMCALWVFRVVGCCWLTQLFIISVSSEMGKCHGGKLIWRVIALTQNNKLGEWTGWRRCTECLELQISLHKRATNHRAFLQKETYKDKASYASSPPCTNHSHHTLLAKSQQLLNSWIYILNTRNCFANQVFAWRTVSENSFAFSPMILHANWAVMIMRLWVHIYN
jgi:hypothetical protein